jgi:hypothetical protein
MMKFQITRVLCFRGQINTQDMFELLKIKAMVAQEFEQVKICSKIKLAGTKATTAG